MTFTIALSGNVNLDEFDGTHLKVRFLDGYSEVKKTGSLLSLGVSAVPAPEIYAIMAVGMGLMGWVARKKKRHAVAV